MNLSQLRCFEAVARHLHFTNAARELMVAQPALSLQIRRLEDELGHQLFDRTTRTVRLTDAGATLLPSAQRILGEIQDAHARLRDARNLEIGRVVVGSQQSLNASGVLPRVLIEFQTRYPGIDLALHEETIQETLTMLADGSMDLALAHLEGQFDFDALEHRPLFYEPVGFIAGPNHPANADPNALIEISELADEAFIAFNETAGLRHMLNRLCGDAGFVPRIACESGALGSVRALVSAGLGIALMPLPSVQELGPPVSILRVKPDLYRTITLVRQRERYHSIAARALVDVLVEQLGTPVQRAA
jgi:DNA-binding transcriptional LysR family regulator